ncbi:MAG: PHP domain-containing protein, partial [Candidatus Omnitrophica bacterium]|nr:PHP domain-containing protein [Candidatus Omnitrophota bacterium]
MADRRNKYYITTQSQSEALVKYPFAKPFEKEFINLWEDIKTIVQFLKDSGKITGTPEGFDAETFALVYHQDGEMFRAEDLTEQDVRGALKELTCQGRGRLHFTEEAIITHIKLHESQLLEEEAIRAQIEEFIRVHAEQGNIDYLKDIVNNILVPLCDIKAFEGSKEEKARIKELQRIARGIRLYALSLLRDRFTQTKELNDYIDLHHHTFFSDGYHSPSAIVFEAWQKGMKAIGIVDHNTFNHFEEAYKAGEILGIQVILGIEFDFYEDVLNIDGKHIVVYFSVKSPEELVSLLEKIKQSPLYQVANSLTHWNLRRQLQIIKNFNEKYSTLGFEILPQDYESFSQHPSFHWTGEALFKKYGADRLNILRQDILHSPQLLNTFSERGNEDLQENKIKNFSDVGDVLIRGDNAIFVKATKIESTDKFIKDGYTRYDKFGINLPFLIKEAQTLAGIICLSHPAEFERKTKKKGLAKELYRKYSFDAIELNGKYEKDDDFEKEKEIKRQITGQDPNLIVVVGSDCHNDPARPEIEMGNGFVRDAKPRLSPQIISGYSKQLQRLRKVKQQKMTSQPIQPHAPNTDIKFHSFSILSLAFIPFLSLYFLPDFSSILPTIISILTNPYFIDPSRGLKSAKQAICGWMPRNLLR